MESPMTPFICISFPHSLTHHATAWFDRLPRNSVNTFEQMAKMFLGKYFPPSMVIKLRNEITNFRQRPDESLFEAWERYKLSIERFPNHNMLTVTQIDTFYNGLTLRHRDNINAAVGETFMKRHPEECYDLIENMTAHHNDWDTSTQQSESSSSITSSSDTKIPPLATPRTYMLPGAYQGNSYQPQGNRNLLSYRLNNYLGPPSFNQNQNRNNQNQNFHNQNMNQGNHNPQGNNQRRNQFFQGASHGQNQPPAYQAPVYQAPVHQPQIPQPQVVTTNEFTNFMKANDDILKNMQTNMTSLQTQILSNTITNPKEDLKGITTRSGTAYQGPTILTTSSSSPVVERETEVTKDTVHPTNNGSTKDVQPSVVQIESLILNPLIAPIIEPVASPVSAPRPNQRLSIPYLSRFHDQKLRGKANDQREKFFQIFKDLNFNISFADALILMPKFGPTIKTLLTNKDKLYELARTPLNEHCSAVLLKKLPEKLGDPGKFLIPCDFLGMAECLALADLGASINLMPLSTGRALIDVFKGELTLRVGKEAITFNLDQTSRYSANYNDMMANRIDVIDMACEEYSQEVHGFSDVISDFLLEEVDAFLALEVDPTSPEVEQSYVNTEGDILLLEAFLNDDPSLPPPNQENYMPQVQKELKICEAKTNKSLIDEPPEVELKDLPPYLEYAFLNGYDKFLVIIAKDLSVEEKTALITVLKSHKKAIAWKLSDIKGIDPEFYTHKILMEEDFKPVVQHQRKVNPKIHDVIKNEVFKLLDAGLIYPISDSPWVSPVHCVPKKGGFTVVENEKNELIPTRLVTGWRVCIDYRKLNEATRKDHFPLPFMDQMLERLARNQYYCFLDGFSGYFQIPVDPKDQEKTTFTCPYETFIQDFSNIARPMTRLLEKDTPFFFSKECVEAFQTLKRKLTKAPILISLDWDMPFELMCDASDFAIGAVLGQRQEIILGQYTMPGIDFMGPFPSSRGNKYILVAVDYLSKWVEVKALPKNDARVVCKFLKNLFARFGPPDPLSVIEERTSAMTSLQRKVQLNKLHDQAYENSLIYKEKTKRLPDSKVKERVFNIGDRALLFNSRLKIFSGKLKSRWSGPFTISYVFPYGTVELSQPDGPNFKVNGHRLKHYFGEDVPKMVVPDLQTFPKDQ
uniref:Reverse transcriptase domain-containing protein n=1 Tax=Tanacetum cinerariifolium TaxID=118510 RepID=A0A699GY76_TANCI|nr:reverse transcriptase domain-containing protein [Tanacetum cinerariifolium]